MPRCTMPVSSHSSVQPVAGGADYATARQAPSYPYYAGPPVACGSSDPPMTARGDSSQPPMTARGDRPRGDCPWIPSVSGAGAPPMSHREWRGGSAETAHPDPLSPPQGTSTHRSTSDGSSTESSSDYGDSPDAPLPLPRRPGPPPVPNLPQLPASTGRHQVLQLPAQPGVPPNSSPPGPCVAPPAADEGAGVAVPLPSTPSAENARRALSPTVYCPMLQPSNSGSVHSARRVGTPREYVVEVLTPAQAMELAGEPADAASRGLHYEVISSLQDGELHSPRCALSPRSPALLLCPGDEGSSADGQEDVDCDGVSISSDEGEIRDRLKQCLQIGQRETHEAAEVEALEPEASPSPRTRGAAAAAAAAARAAAAAAQAPASPRGRPPPGAAWGSPGGASLASPPPPAVPMNTPRSGRRPDHQSQPSTGRQMGLALGPSSPLQSVPGLACAMGGQSPSPAPAPRPQSRSGRATSYSSSPLARNRRPGALGGIGSTTARGVASGAAVGASAVGARRGNTSAEPRPRGAPSLTPQRHYAPVLSRRSLGTAAPEPGWRPSRR